MIDQLAKDYLRDDLRSIRAAILWKVDGVPEYDLRRPLTRTGTNLLGLVKHLALWESRYLGDVFDRPFSEPLPRWDDREQRGRDLWADQGESSTEIVERYRRVGLHSEETIDALDLDAVGHVPWWPQPEVTLFGILLHVIGETTRHAGHADILREQLDGVTGAAAGPGPARDEAFWARRRATIERAARVATGQQDQ